MAGETTGATFVNVVLYGFEPMRLAYTQIVYLSVVSGPRFEPISAKSRLFCKDGIPLPLPSLPNGVQIRFLRQALRAGGMPDHVRDRANQFKGEAAFGRHDDDAVDKDARDAHADYRVKTPVNICANSIGCAQFYALRPAFHSHDGSARRAAVSPAILPRVRAARSPPLEK